MNRPTSDEIYKNHRDLQRVDAARSAIEAQLAAAEKPTPNRTTSDTTSLSIEDAVAKDLKTGQS